MSYRMSKPPRQKASWRDVEEIEEISQSPRTSIIVRVVEEVKTGKIYVDQRKHVMSDNYAGPTRKGIMVEIGTIPAIMAALGEAYEKYGGTGIRPEE